MSARDRDARYDAAHRGQILERDCLRAHGALSCCLCGVPLRWPDPDGVCGFCREELSPFELARRLEGRERAA